MKKNIFILFFCLIAVHCHGLDRNSRCLRDLEVNFFEQNITGQAMNLYSIPPSQWLVAIQQLQNLSQNVPQLVDRRAQSIRPNPFNYPPNPIIAQQLLLDVLEDVFTSAMTETFQNLQRSDVTSIPEMFKFIKQSQRWRLVACFGDVELMQQQLQQQQQQQQLQIQQQREWEQQQQQQQQQQLQEGSQ